MNARDLLAQRVAQWTGFDLDRGGSSVVLDRLLERRAKALGASSVDAFAASLGSPEDPEVRRLIEGLTIGYTWFFRDQEQMAMIGQVLPMLFGATLQGECWVAGCSTGEEAYTLAMLAASAGIRMDVLATDINSEALDRARCAQYGLRATRDVPASLRTFLRPNGDHAVVVDAAARDQVRFERHSLLEPAPKPRARERWPLIVCRNVLIYFRPEVAAAVVERLAEGLSPGGYLFLGASDVLQQAPSGCALVPLGNRYAIQRTSAAPVSRAARPLFVPPAVVVGHAPMPEPPERIDQVLERALDKVHEGDLATALALCSRVLEGDVLCAEAHLISGIAFYLSDDPSSAIRALRTALLLDPDEWVASFYLARSYDQLGRKDDALREYRVTETSSRSRCRPTRLRGLEAWKDEIALLARARAARGGR